MPRRPDGAVLALMGMQITVWAALFYSFPALVLNWQAEFGWSLPRTMGAFTLAIAIYALGAPLFGRLVDRGLAPVTMPLGAATGAALLVGLTFVDSLVVFYAIWGAMGVVMGLTLYEPCFAVVTRARGAGARRAITAITLVGGFASTLAYPLTHWISLAAGWRTALYAMAGMVVLAAVPLARMATARMEAEAAARRTEAAAAADTIALPRPALLRSPVYWRLAAGFAMAGLASGILLSHLLPVMAAQGVPPATAILAASLVGPAQVAGRVALMATADRIHGLRIAQAAMASLSLGAVLLLLAAGAPWLALVFGVLQGAGYGVVGILRAVLTRELLGERDYGAIAGAVALPTLLLFALAPLLAAALAQAAGYGAVLVACVAAPILGGVLLQGLVGRRA